MARFGDWPEFVNKYQKQLDGLRAQFSNLFPQQLQELTNGALDTFSTYVKTAVNQVHDKTVCYVLQPLVHYVNGRNVRYHLSWNPMTEGKNERWAYDLVKVPFDFQYSSNRLLGKWFSIVESTTATDATYEGTISPGTGICFRKGKDQVEFIAATSEQSKWFNILESRLLGKKGSLFSRHFPLGIEITEFSRLVFRKPDLDISLPDTTWNLEEMLPFILCCLSTSVDCPNALALWTTARGPSFLQRTPPVTFYEKDSLYVSILLDESFDEISISAKDSVYPFVLTQSIEK